MKKLKNIWQMPWSIIYTWNKNSNSSTINMIDYNEKEVKQLEINNIEECNKHLRRGVRRIDFIGLDQTEDIEELWEKFKIHPLTLEDIVNIQQRPKMEEMENYIFVVLKMFNIDEKTDKINEEQISLVLSKEYVISFQENEGNDDFLNLKDRIINNKWKIRKMKPDYLMYSILDSIVDQYFVVLENIENKIENLQEELITDPNPKTLPKIQNIKKELIWLRKSIRPVREIISNLQKIESKLIQNDLDKYLRDVYDHTIQIIDTIETFRDVISNSVDIYLSSINNRMNEIMKVLTIMWTIFIPLTFIVWLYGMNFKYMPEFGMKRAYPILRIVMLAIVGLMLRYFKRKKWL